MSRRLRLNQLLSTYTSSFCYVCAAPPAGDTTGSLWAARVVSAGGAEPAASTVSAINKFITSCSLASIQSKLLHVNVVAPDSLTAALTPIIYSPASSSYTNINFVSGDLGANGLTGNGSNKYLRTGFIPTTHFGSNTEAGITAYFYDIPNVATMVDIAANSSKQCMLQAADGVVTFQYGAPGFGYAADASPENGYYSGNRTSATQNNLYYAKSDSAHSSVASSTTDNSAGDNLFEIYVFTGNENGSPQPYYSNRTLSFIAFHQPFSSTESSDFFNAVQQLRVDLGGGYR